MTTPPRQQGGYFLIAITAALAVIAFGFIIAYSSLLAKKQQQTLFLAQQAYMADVNSALTATYAQNAGTIDSITDANNWNATSFLSLAGIQLKWGAQVAFAQGLVQDGINYSVIVVWLPTNTDTTNPPNFNETTGAFVSCTNTQASCSPRAYAIISGLTIQATLQANAIKQLDTLAGIHQAYFKAKLLQDPDKNIAINYFRAPDGNCANASNMPCIDTYTNESLTAIPGLLGISSDLLINPWGLPIEVSNNEGSSLSYPFSLSIKSETPWGSFINILAIQPV